MRLVLKQRTQLCVNILFLSRLFQLKYFIYLLSPDNLRSENKSHLLN